MEAPCQGLRPGGVETQGLAPAGVRISDGARIVFRQISPLVTGAQSTETRPSGHTISSQIPGGNPLQPRA